jgi:hypothetical protein
MHRVPPYASRHRLSVDILRLASIVSIPHRSRESRFDGAPRSCSRKCSEFLISVTAFRFSRRPHTLSPNAGHEERSPDSRVRAKLSDIPVSDHGTLEGLTQFLTQFLDAGPQIAEDKSIRGTQDLKEGFALL